MSYKSDVFISYKRDDFRDEWLSEHFLPAFRSYVREEIARTCKRQSIGIYFDETEIVSDKRKMKDRHGLEPGDEWRAALRDAIKTSRCVVCLWSPEYFFSQWCTIEWRSFIERGKATGRKLVVPLSVHDGDSFPQEAQELQAIDISDFVIPGEGFKKTEDYPLFQKRLKSLAITVAQCVNQAPEFADFAVSEGPTSEAVVPPAGPDIALHRLK
jgi:hypothetical protein